MKQVLLSKAISFAMKFGASAAAQCEPRGLRPPLQCSAIQSKNKTKMKRAPCMRGSRARRLE
jgi:hypothetical protein